MGSPDMVSKETLAKFLISLNDEEVERARPLGRRLKRARVRGGEVRDSSKQTNFLDPDFVGAADTQKDGMQAIIDEIDKALKDPELMRKIQQLMDQEGMAEVKSVVKDMVSLLPPARKQMFERAVEAPDCEESS